MTAICTKCGTPNDVPKSLAPPFERCKKCGARFDEQHMHIELSAPVVVPAPRPADDVNRAAWRKQIADYLQEVDRYDFEARRFVPCNICRAKTGSPTLCGGCLANRQTIDELHEKLEKKTRTAAALRGEPDIRRLSIMIGEMATDSLKNKETEAQYKARLESLRDHIDAVIKSEFNG